MTRQKILISACLLGMPVRYDGRGKPFLHPALQKWQAEGRLVALCPEMSAGLPVPRPPAEIEPGMTGEDVLQGRARVMEVTGGDVTAAFLKAAENALALARREGCAQALLIDGSPSCGSAAIYDGRFAGMRHAGMGVTAALLSREGIAVFTPAGVEDLVRLAG